MSGLQGFKSAYNTLGPAGALATVAGAIAVVVVGASFWSFGRAAMTTAPSTSSSNSVAGKSEAQDAAFKGYLAQIEGRSLFLVPGAPVKEPEVVVDETPKGPPPPPPPPSEYGGSSIIAMVMDTVWFDDGRKMKVGDPEKEETEVLAVRAPWEAELKWKGVKFTVPFFGRDKVVLKDAGSSSGAAKTSTGSSDSSPATSPSTEPEVKPPSIVSEGGTAPPNNASGPTGASGNAGADASKKTDAGAKPVEKVVGPANSPSKEPEHPQVVVNKPPPGEKPTPPPGGIPPPPPPPDAPRN